MIYPEEFSGKKTPDNAEWLVYQAMQKLSETDFDVFWHRTFSVVEGRRNIEFEIDFIVADLRNNSFNGLVCIEVKGGQLLQKNNETWLQNGNPIDSPVKQVTSAMHNLVDLYPSVANEVPFGWMVCFPHTVTGNSTTFPTNIDEAQLIDKDKLQNLPRILSDFFDQFGKRFSNHKGMSIVDYCHFIEHWIKEYGFVLPLSARIAEDESLFIKLTQDQMGVIKAAGENDRLRIKGVAGSGKTVIARELAVENIKSGKKVLFLCYNRTLASNIDTSLKSLGKRNKQIDGKNFNVKTYHSFAATLINKVDPGWWGETQYEEGFFDVLVPLKVLEAKELMDKPELYDVIIIDEGQDFMEDWYESVLCFLKDNGKIFVFMDDFQNINQTCAMIPELQTFIKLSLDENCRNTKAINEKMNEIINLEDFSIRSKAGVPDGEPVKIIQYINDTDQQTKVLQEIRRLVEEEEVRPDKILILLNTDKENSCLARTNNIGSLGLIPLNSSGTTNQYSISYTHIKTFKGLEADIVFIVDTDKVNYDSFLFYTQVSRARHLLYIFKKED